MKINTALILCAGYGKRLNPITLKIPKPLIKINDITLLDKTLSLIENLDIKKIKINTFYLQEQITNFISNHHLKKNIEIIQDGTEILDTGGGILNLIKSSKEKDFIVFNPDTLWNKNYVSVINKMQKYYFENDIKNLLMVVNKIRSFDKRFKGDFSLSKNKLNKSNINEYIYTGCQIINKNLFKDIKDLSFSISKVWKILLDKNLLYGVESEQEFIHLTDLEIYNDLSKNN
tara:strand:+ start:16726 stop:17418 length:693 start_codon:yes stop_codon:yes gene_type:complete